MSAHACNTYCRYAVLHSLHLFLRLSFVLQDVIELRERKWVSRNQVALSTIAQIHEVVCFSLFGVQRIYSYVLACLQPAKDRAAAAKQSYQRQMSMSPPRAAVLKGPIDQLDGVFRLDVTHQKDKI
jgi:hypothetical protein